MKLKEILCLLEERLTLHDDSRRDVQNKLQEVCIKMLEEVDQLEEKINKEICKSFAKTEERILGLIEKLNNKEDEDNILDKARQELLMEQRYDIGNFSMAENFASAYKLIVIPFRTKKKIGINEEENEEDENIVYKLKEHLNKIHESTVAVQNKLTEICTRRRNEVNEMEAKINKKLEAFFVKEDARIQDAVNSIREEGGDNMESDELIIKGKAALVVNQGYSLIVPTKGYSCDNYDIKLTKDISLKPFDFDERTPSKLGVSFTDRGEISYSFSLFNNNEMNALKAFDLPLSAVISLWQKDRSEDTLKTFTKEWVIGKPILVDDIFSASTLYSSKIKFECCGSCTKWSDDIEFTTPEFNTCIWRECPVDIDEKRKYSVDEKDSRVATKTGEDDYFASPCVSIITGNTSLPLNKVTSWSIKILKSRYNSGCEVYVGVAPFDINLYKEFNFFKCGWYFYCLSSTLRSGPPHNYNGKIYGPTKERKAKHVCTGSTVGVIMDTTKGDLSFILNGINNGVAYEGIPLDKPLVPCVFLYNKDDSVELDHSEVKENVDSSVPVPSDIKTKSVMWDSITLEWNIVEGAEFYQIEVDESRTWNVSTTNIFTKRGLLGESEHSFRVRSVKENSASEWSVIVKAKTQKASEFKVCFWKECPEHVYKERRYFVDENNHTTATKRDKYNYCTIIGNTPLPVNKVTSWNIKILKSRNNDGNDIYIGVAPFDIDQNGDESSIDCGWYFYCYNSTLLSGPPHNYDGKEYTSKKEREGEYVHTGDSIEVIMDTLKGELSFILNGVNYGVAYEGIPLDKPLVPCVLLKNDGDSVELII